MKIRKYQEKDKDNLRHICIHTARPVPPEERKRQILTLLYCDYFAENESENIFVAADENDNAIGYILCCTDFEKYRYEMKNVYLKRVKNLSFGKWLMGRLELIYQARKIKKYPAFLHIDILDGYQRMGLGHKLMNALMELLQGKGIGSVMLGVGSDNEKGINFYKKYGFHIIQKGPGFVSMGYHTGNYIKK